jgi:hypothetical protein
VSLGSLDDRPLQAGAIDGSREGCDPMDKVVHFEIP